ncbi:MAG: hypothetical protein KC594_10050 [Nitrospira sp.]|nr:hypothetical protein [Nitrospira sp.]
MANGQFADFAVLSNNYFPIPEEEIKRLESVLTVVNGRIEYAAQEFSQFAPPALPVSLSWSPVGTYGGFAASNRTIVKNGQYHAQTRLNTSQRILSDNLSNHSRLLECDCFAF